MLKQRIITALILAPIAIGGIFFLPAQAFAWFIGFIIVVGAWEWANLAGFEAQSARCVFALVVALLLGFVSLFSLEAVLGVSVLGWIGALYLITQYPNKVPLWQSPFARLLMGLLVLIPAWYALVGIRQASSFSYLGEVYDTRLLIIYIMFIIWGADVGAYFAGRAWGNKKLAPSVSPGKSWAGVYGGLVTSGLFALLASYLLGLSVGDSLLLIVITLITGAFSVTGDLLESMLKRHCGIKDSSQLLPGHGGVLDRIDSLTAAVPVFTFMLILVGWLL